MKNFWLQDKSITALAVCMLALAEIIDLTIVGVAVPHIMSSLGCNIQEISMVTTSYIVSAAVVIMMTGFMSQRFGSKKLILISTVLFGGSSILCGMASSLPLMIFFRILQGIGGAFLPSMAQGYIVANFEGKEQERMMLIMTLTMVLGPIIGPVLGGFLVQSYSWRWIFYVNVPLCAIAFVIISLKMVETTTKKVNFDFLSFFFMVVGFGFLEYFLDEGNSKDWLSSHEMLIILEIGILGLMFFLWRAKLGKSIVNLSVFSNKNFAIGTVYIFTFVVLMTGSIAFYATMLQTGYGMPVDLAGYLCLPQGISALIGAGIATVLTKFLESRKILFIGIVLFILSGLMKSNFGMSWNYSSQIISGILLGTSMTIIFVITLQIAFVGISSEQSSDAAGIFNFFRNIGSSVGTSISSIIITRQQQVSWNELSGHISGFNPNLQQLTQMASTDTLVMNAGQLIQQQAYIIANIDLFYFATYGAVILILLTFFFKPGKSSTVVHLH